MAKKKVSPIVKQYRVLEKFTGWINDKQFRGEKGSIITLNDDEYKVYARFVQEIQQ